MQTSEISYYNLSLCLIQFDHIDKNHLSKYDSPSKTNKLYLDAPILNDLRKKHHKNLEKTRENSEICTINIQIRGKKEVYDNIWNAMA
jgi:hypothetical protein